MMRASLIALLITWPAQTLGGPTITCGPPFKVDQPTSCCDAGDVVKTKFKVESGSGLHPQDTWFCFRQRSRRLVGATTC